MVGKRCIDCGEWAPLEALVKARGCTYGRRALCRACSRERARRWRAENPEHLRKQHAAWREENKGRKAASDRAWYERNREARAQYHREWYARNRDAVIARSALWRRANPEQMREHRRAWAERNPEKAEAYRRYRHQLQQGAAPTLAALDYMAILNGDRCSYCAGPVEEMDHVVPVARGGDGEWNNFTAACAPCNRLKSDKPLLRFLLGRLAA